MSNFHSLHHFCSLPHTGYFYDMLLLQMWWMSQKMHIRVPWTLPRIRCSRHILFVLVLLSTTLYSSMKYRILLTRHVNWLNRLVVTYSSISTTMYHHRLVVLLRFLNYHWRWVLVGFEKKIGFS